MDYTVECVVRDNGDVSGVRIIDQGPGLSDGQLRYLFEPGYTSKTGGNGLGLSISRQLCRLAGGDLRMVHTGSNGTSFEACLARDSEDA